MNRYSGNHKEEFKNWRNNTLVAIEKLNKILGNELTGEGFYNLEYRGRSHHCVLTLDGDVIARGMYAINETLRQLFLYYNI